MRRNLVTLAVLLLAGAAVFVGTQRLAAHWCRTYWARPGDDLAWLRLEFRLSEAELAGVRRLHEGYLPKCRDFCARIAARKRELQALLAAPTFDAAAVESKLVEINMLRAQCQAAMLEHFREVSAVMPPAQGRRYLAEMQRLTLGSHEDFERAMTPDATLPHGHR